MKLNISKDELQAILVFAEAGIIRARDNQGQLGGFKKQFLDKTIKNIEQLRKKVYGD